MPAIATRYREYVAHQPTRARAREAVRDAAVTALAPLRSRRHPRDAIRFVAYHHVFDDEVAGFERQLTRLARAGDFVTIDEAVGVLACGEPITGLRFCLTFDDGYRNHRQNALPILERVGIPAAFFVITDLVGTSPDRDLPRLVEHFAGGALVDFLDWDDCRALAAAGMTIGSHTASHTALSALDVEGVRHELRASKAKIETETGRPCEHLCAPFGVPGTYFDPARDPALAAEAGYRSFSTGVRGAMRRGDSPLLLRRDQLLAGWSGLQLRYFLGA